MKKPCDTCYIAICTYYEFPCSICNHNPHTDNEIETEIGGEVGTRKDMYKHYKGQAEGN